MLVYLNVFELVALAFSTIRNRFQRKLPRTSVVFLLSFLFDTFDFFCKRALLRHALNFLVCHVLDTHLLTRSRASNFLIIVCEAFLETPILVSPTWACNYWWWAFLAEVLLNLVVLILALTAQIGNEILAEHLLK